MTPRPMLRSIYNKVIQLSKRVFELPKEKNKGAVGLFLESLTGIPQSNHCLDCLDGEIKVFEVKKTKKGTYVPKETIAITMLSKKSLMNEDFIESKCFKKITNVLYVPYLRDDSRITYLKPTIIHLLSPPNNHIFEKVKYDYHLIKTRYIETNTLDHTSSIGTYLQNRTKGAGGKTTKTRGYYLKRRFIKECILNTNV
jgi:DNA mismatch repair protein MutH